MYVPPEKLDHFLSFITSTHVIQDLPVGEKSLKLSSHTEIKVPNVIRFVITYVSLVSSLHLLRRKSCLGYMFRKTAVAPMTYLKLVTIFQITFSEEGTNAIIREEKSYRLFLNYLKEVAGNLYVQYCVFSITDGVILTSFCVLILYQVLCPFNRDFYN
jgi:hypothetical protein